MKYNVSELESRMLDRAVAKAEGLQEFSYPEETALWVFRPGNGLYGEPDRYEPSSDWSIAGPIIQRERIAVYSPGDVYGTTYWIAGYDLEAEAGRYYSEETGSDPPTLALKHSAIGPTPLVAAMRAYVASRLGEEIEL